MRFFAAHRCVCFVVTEVVHFAAPIRLNITAQCNECRRHLIYGVNNYDDVIVALLLLYLLIIAASRM